MLRRLTKEETQKLESIDDADIAFRYITSLGEMGELFGEPHDLVTYLNEIDKFITTKSLFRESYNRSYFAKSLLIGDSYNELPVITRKRVSMDEAVKFANSVFNQDDEYWWPDDLIANQYCISNVATSNFCDNAAAKWDASYFEDREDFIYYIRDHFVYCIETLPNGVHIEEETINTKSTAKKETKLFGTKRNGKVSTTTKTTGRGKNKMMNFFGDDFGKIEGMGLSVLTGELAIPAEDGRYFTFNPKTKEITDVSAFVMEMDLPAYAMPVSANTIVPGDIVQVNYHFLFVSSVTKAGKITGINPDTSEEITVAPIKNAVLNQSFVAKVTTINMLTDAMATPGAEADGSKGPFGNMNPMMLMMMMNKDGDDSMMSKMMLPMMMQQGGLTGGADGQMNPMMMMMLMDKMG